MTRVTPRARRLARLFGITESDYDRLLAKQGGKCAICRKPPKTRRLSVDHDHAYERGNPHSVRGLLHFHCNKFLVGRHTLETARAVVRYLEAFERKRSAA